MILTWKAGYAKALLEAESARGRGDVPVFLKHARQDSPDAETWKLIHTRSIPLLSVSSRFAGEGWTWDELARATQEAWRQSQEGLTGMPQTGQLSPLPRDTQPSTTTVLTDEERREYLRAMYGNPEDDGVR
ncbi:hypothetical protein [Pseudorhodoferax soli]|uniref:hypothetical protein n=1 Tax=Pseudorhodoferax soli TaxID=545864 RepID=UPI0011C08130|nr:hypothetical protein [Pseudorhodoferax soli]